MSSFSERYGYTKPFDVIISERMPKSIANAICNWYVAILRSWNNVESIKKFELTFWTKYLNEYDLACPVLKKSNKKYPILEYWQNATCKWYKKLDALEFVCSQLKLTEGTRYHDHETNLNKEFERLNYGYRLLDGIIIKTTNSLEIESIQLALEEGSTTGVEMHISTALKLLSPSLPNPDYRNSIKESISAVECYCRELTGQNTLDDSLKRLIQKGISINTQMKAGFEKLYHYTNDSKTGVRHALMDDVNMPSADEALYMLVICCAFINYLSKKKIKIE